MNVDLRLLIVALLLMPLSALAQGFAGMGTQATEDFSNPVRDRPLVFPQDHGPHPGYRIEWWYLTANLQADDGTDYGIQWTLFRSALAPERTDGWDSPQIWMAHAGLTTPDRHFAAERFARDGVGQAGADRAPFSAWLDDWEMTSTGGADPLDALRVTAGGDGFSYDLSLSAEGPLVLQGDRGFSVKSPSGQASYYYSQPFYRIAGTLTIDGREIAVTGNGWLDREWSSQPLDEDQTGWDWFSLHLDNGEKVMGFRLRARDRGADFTAATWIGPDGTSEPLPDGAFQVEPLSTEPVADRAVPVEWRVRVPDRGLDITTRPLNRQSWMDTLFPYWEGPIFFTGSHDGRGYLEMTGYE